MFYEDKNPIATTRTQFDPEIYPKIEPVIPRVYHEYVKEDNLKNMYPADKYPDLPFNKKKEEDTTGEPSSEDDVPGEEPSSPEDEDTSDDDTTEGHDGE